MARNGSGTYSVVNTFVAGNTITAAGHNDNWSDLATEMSNSVAADGQTTITGALKGASGTVSAPGYGFSADSNTGTYRIGADNLGIAAGGTKIIDVATTGAAVTGTLSASGAVTASSTLAVTGNVAVNTNKFNVTAASGNTTVAGTLGVTGATTLSSTAEVTGNFTVNTNKLSVTAASGNTSIAGTLAVTGATTLSSTVSATNATFSGAVSGATVAGAMVATQANQETATATDLLVSPGRQHFHPSASKAWAKFAADGTLNASYNVTSVTHDATGKWTVTIANDFSSANYAIIATAGDSSAQITAWVQSQAAGTFTVWTKANNGAFTDPDVGIFFACYGDL